MTEYEIAEMKLKESLLQAMRRNGGGRRARHNHALAGMFSGTHRREPDRLLSGRDAVALYEILLAYYADI